jgi:hypothetical protein
MRTRNWTIGFTLAALLVAAPPALAAFDITLEVAPGADKRMKIEKPTPGRDFVENVASYIRIIPKEGNRVFPAFITTHNYLTCPDTNQRWNLVDVKQVSAERRSGTKVLGFFFKRPACDNPTFHMEPILADG